jgi:tetratricopeptide (TPR) repeat protein
MRSGLLLLITGISIFAFSSDTKADDRGLCFNSNNLPTDAIPACDRLLKSVKQGKDAAAILVWRGVHRSNAREYVAAIADLTESIRMAPNNPATFYFRAQAHYASGHFDETVADTSSAIQLNSKQPDYFELRADALGKKNDVDGASLNYGQAIKLKPAAGRYYFKRAMLLSNAKKYDEALKDLGEAVRINEKDANSFNYRGFVLDAKGEPDRALVDYARAISLSPGTTTAAIAHNNRGWIFFKRFEYEQSLNEFKSAIKFDRNNTSSWHGLTNTLIILERFDEAIEKCNEWIAVDAKDARPYNYLGAAWQAKRDLERALPYFNEAVRRLPDDEKVLNNRGNVWREKGDLDKAFADYDRSIELDPKGSSAYSNRGLAWRARDDLDRAIADFDKSIALDSKNSDAFVNRGLAYEAKGEIEKAKVDFQSAMDAPAKYLFSKRYKEAARARLQVLASSGSLQPVQPPSDPGDTRRVALVIGNGKYVHAGTLANPPNDARLISKNLRDIGFEVVDGFDLDKPAMRSAINDFLATSAKAKTAVVFYAGHGMQVDGKNYLVPVDFDISGIKDAAAEMIDVDFILSGLDDQIRTNIIILDACRNNPLADEARKVADAGRSISVRSGLATPSGLGAGATLGAGTLLAFATAPGQVALDGEGANSPFSSALGRHISTPGVEVQQMLTRVRAEVVAATKNKQVPWSNSSLLGEVYLVKSN